MNLKSHLLIAFVFAFTFSQAQTVYHWQIDNLTEIGGNSVEVFGDPTVAIFEGEGFSAIKFDGVDDGIIVDFNPLSGAAEFTAEVVFFPEEDATSNEPRFVHFQQDDDNRVLIELRNTSGSEWYIDTFIKSGGTSNEPLIDENKTHPTGEWQHAALIYTGGKMSHYVNGVKELEGDAVYTAMSSGKVSLGMRMNERNYLKGYIRELRVTHKALAPSEFLINQGEVEGPELVKPIEDMTETLGFGTATIDLSEYFSGDALSYSVTSDAESVVSGSVSGTDLVITEKGEGTSAITVVATNASGFLSEDFQFTVEEALSVDGQSGGFLLYPNPTKNASLLDLWSDKSANLSVVVSDLSGRKVQSLSTSLNTGNNEINLDFSSLENGIYLVSLDFSGRQEVMKLIKE